MHTFLARKNQSESNNKVSFIVFVLFSALRMPRTPKDVLADSDIESNGEYDREDVASSSQLVPPCRESGTKRARTSRATNNGGRGKRRKNSTPRDVEVVNESSSDSIPLTRGDIPSIVSTVLHSIKSTEAQEDDEPDVSTLPGESSVYSL